MNNLTQKDYVFQVDVEVKQLKKDINGGFLELAKRLKEIRDNKYYIQLDYDTFEAYIAQPELGFDRTSVYRFISIYEKFVIELKVPHEGLLSLDYNKLDMLIPHITEENKEELLNKAQTLSRSDLREEMQLLKVPTKIISLPEGKYNVIYADPPWEYDVDLAHTRSPENHYPVMSLEEIKNFGEKVKQISADNCVLFMWITAPKLNWMMDVLNSWGFEYKTNLIWDKVKHNMGHYSSVRHEILVIAGKGSAAPKCDGTTIQSIDSVQVIDKTTIHSQKPIEFMEIIEKLYPNSKKIELFARNIREGWEGWGNELPTKPT